LIGPNGALSASPLKGFQMEVAFDMLKEQLSLYGKIPDGDAGWKREHRDAMACGVIEDAIAMGLSLFDGLVRRGLKEKITVFEGREVCELYKKWLDDSRSWLACAAVCLRKGYKVKGASDLSEKAWIISSWLPEMRDLSKDLTDVIDGHGIPFEQVLNAI
jgi:hypothetical protein